MIFETAPADFNPKFEVAGCFCEYDGKILFLLRQDHKPQGNTYGAPSGKLNGNETAIETVIREVNEEANVALEPDDLKFVKALFVRYDEFDFVYHMYKAMLNDQHVKSIIINYNEHKSLKWLTPGEALLEKLIQDEDTCLKICFNI